ncbi:MAG TPA: hypothetical protein VMW74_01330, partial [Nitrosopumilaceae archaeon]|nr:hypothetical protein [Nitrosopumilaceae archaeon]
HRLIKDRVMDFMCMRKNARLSFMANQKELSLKFGKNMAYDINYYNYIDWGKAIREFWKDESLKDYRSYFITK